MHDFPASPAHGCSPEAKWRPRPQHSHTKLNNNHAGLHTYWSYYPSAWHARSQAHQLTYLLTCIISGSMAACWQEQLHYHATKSQLSAQNSILYGLNTKLPLGKGTLRQFLESLWPAIQVIVTLVWYNPNPTCLAPQKMWHPFGWQTKFTTHHVIHGDGHPTHTLHPAQGHASVLCRKDRYHFSFSCYH